MNKKALFLLGALVLGATVGCDKENNSTNTNNSTNNPAPAAEKYSVGLGYTAKYEWKAATDWAPAMGQLDVTTAFAAFDKDGKVYDVRFDVVQVKVTANTDEGATEALKLQSALVDGSVQTKLELGSAYGMKDTSAEGGLIEGGAEVNTQIEAFADYCAGKTVAEVIAGTTGIGHGSEAVAPELEGKVTITVDDFEVALMHAFNHKTAATYELSGTAGVAMNSGFGYNYGTAEITVDVAGVIAKNGTVEAAKVDAIVCQLDFNVEDSTASVRADQKYVVDGKFVSKYDLGDAYGMAERNEGFQGCTKEWYEQADIIAKAAEGKTIDQIKALAADTGDLAGATIYLNSYTSVLAKACDYAGRTVINPN